MLRRALPAVVFILLAAQGTAEQLHVPGLSPEVSAPRLDLPACEELPQNPNNCARVLACLGQDGLYFDGQARGWNEGTIAGQLSTGAVCAGTYEYGGLFGTAKANFECSNGVTGWVIYYAQDEVTNTLPQVDIHSADTMTETTLRRKKTAVMLSSICLFLPTMRQADRS